MYVYHDFNYVKYILEIEFDKGFDLYCNCIIRINEEIIKNEDNKLWLAFINSGFEGTFEDYKKELEYKHKSNTLSIEAKDNEIERIINKSEDLRQRMDEEDEKNKLNEIRNEVIIQ